MYENRVNPQYSMKTSEPHTVETTTDFAKLIGEWKEAKEALENARVLENDLRKQVVSMAFAKSDNREGTFNRDLEHGWKLKVVFKQNRTLNEKELGKALTAIADKGPEGFVLAKRLVSYKPTLAVGEYKKLATEFRTIMDTVVITKPGLPELTLVAPKIAAK